mgnify:CR=1 FL=1
MAKKMNIKISITSMAKEIICFSSRRRARCLASMLTIIRSSIMISHRQASTRLRSGKALQGVVVDRTMKDKESVPEVDRDRETEDNMETTRITRGMLEATGKE